MFLRLKKLGMRNVKTGIGIGLSVLCSPTLVQTPVFTAIACMVSIQETVKDSLVMGLSRIKGTILGGIIGYLFALIGVDNALLCTLGIITTIYICNHFDLTEEISIACVTFMAIHIGDIEGSLISYSVHRIIDTSVGVIIGVLINYILARPKHTENIHSDLVSIEKAVSKYLDNKLIKKHKKYNLKDLENAISNLDKSYSRYTSEFSYLQESENCSDNDINNLVILSKELYFHIQSIEMLKQNLYLNKSNYDKIKYLYEVDVLDWDISENKSPVFNYHLRRILKQISLLRAGINNHFSDTNNEDVLRISAM